MVGSADCGDWLASLGDFDDYISYQLCLFVSSLAPAVGHFIKPIPEAITGLLQDQPAEFKCTSPRTGRNMQSPRFLCPPQPAAVHYQVIIASCSAQATHSLSTPHSPPSVRV